MEIDISKFFNEAAPMDYSASVAEIGANAGAATWQAAKDAAGEFLLIDTPEKRAAFDSWAREFGAWDDDELAAHSAAEANALFLQFVAGDMREADIGPDSTPDDWKEYEMRQHRGEVSSYIFRADDGRVFFSLDH